jgi:serine/threonine protein kinase
LDAAESTAPTLAGDGEDGPSARATPASARSTPAPAARVDMHADTAIGHAGDADDGTETESSDPVTDEENLVGQTLRGRYQMARQIGQGGMGAVYEAKDKNLGGKRVAVKVLLDKYAQKDQVVARLQQEARLASSIGHPNIINITDFGNTVDGRTFVVMEYLDGESLGGCLERAGALPSYRTIKIARQCASALGDAHKKGIIHRDIKPENIFLEHRGDEDFVKVVDFGISKSVRPDSGDESPRLTQTGMVLGTPLYMAPEQARGDESPDHRVDIYSLGVIMYEMITGEIPFKGTNYLNILTQVVSQEPPLPSEIKPEVSKDVEAVILKAMAKDPAERYQTMEELDTDLAELAAIDDGTSTAARITASRRRGRRRRGTLPKMLVWSTGLAVIAGVVAVVVMLMMRRIDEGPSAAAAAQPAVADDAAPVSAPVDASVPKRAEVELIEIMIKTTPADASIYWGDTLVCEPTPCAWRVPKQNQDYTLTAEKRDARGEVTLAGEIKLNPLSHDPGKAVSVRLKAPPKNAPDRSPRKRSPDSKAAPRESDAPKDRTGGDFVRPGFGKKSPN